MELPAYSRMLNAEVERKRREREADTAAKGEAVRIAHETRLTPVVDRLRKLISSLPPEVRTSPHSLEFFRQALRGRQGKCAQAGEIGIALTQLGWIRKRGWSAAAGGFRALWYPPTSA